MSQDRSGSAFPYFHPFQDGSEASDGITKREWYATFAPLPTFQAVENEEKGDATGVPYGGTKRTRAQIEADLRFKYADEMIAASQRTP